ncbi:MAG: hypothetical protein ACRD15_23600 [Vicinamibacterales bacterium]
MEPLLIILVPGLLGGLVLALLIAGTPQRAASPVVPRRLAAPSPGLINMAHIHVEGVGGLGMVAAVVAVAVSDPRIRLATILASVLGTGLALVLIAMRRRNGALPSSGDGPGDRSTLRIDGERRPMHLADVRGTIDQVIRAGAMRGLDAGGCPGPV